MAVIGIDLGTTYCAAARYVNGQAEVIPLNGQATMPSVVGVLNSGKLAVGWPAKRNQAKNPQDTLVEVKRKMGDKAELQLGQGKYAPQEISAMILAEIKRLVTDELGEDEKITGAVITCPAYFKEPQREATMEAGKLAGLNVLRILNEPTAAAAAYGVTSKQNDEENLFLVYDLGGGTFDVTVISMVAGNLDVIGTGGDPLLGGGNFDDCIVDWMLARLERIPGYAETLTEERRKALRLRLKLYAEEAKIKLCGPPSNPEYRFQIASVDKFNGKPVPFTETLTMSEFEGLIMDLVKNSLHWVDVALKVPLQERNHTEADITEILLVGGSTRVPLIRKALEKRFPNTPIHGVEKGINPDEIVALGAAIIAAGLDPEAEELPEVEIVLVDVTGHTLSVEVQDERTLNLYLHPLIAKDTPIPCDSAHRFRSKGNFQTACRVRVYQGEGKDPKGNDVVMIGEFDIEIDPIKEETPLDVGLDLNRDGILEAHATNGNTGVRASLKICYEGSAKLPADELKRRQAALAAQREAVVGRSHNPLDDAEPASAGAAQTAAGGATAAGAQASATAANPADLMHPIVRALYEKAISSFARIPADKRMTVMQLVSELETAAKAGDTAKQMELYDPLNTIIAPLG